MQAMVTHNDPMAIASSIVVAYAVALLIRLDVRQLSNIGQKCLFCWELADSIAGIEDGCNYTSRKDAQSCSLAKRIRDDIPRFLRENRPPSEVQKDFWSGAYVLESLPFALYCFLLSPGHFDQVIYSAVNESKDSDTVAAMACTFCGALNGLCVSMDRMKITTDIDCEFSAIKKDVDYLDELEFREELIDVADRLLQKFCR